jgi:hypothetical protein
MSCFGGIATPRGTSRRRPWRWWRAKCAGIAASVGSRIRRSVEQLDGRRATSSSVMHHRRQYSSPTTSFAPVYVDELYNLHRHQQPSSKLNDEPSTSGKLVGGVGGATRSSGKAKGSDTAAAGVGAMKNVLMRSPGRGGGVLGAVKGMGEVDLRAELFIRKFKEEMRLQSQRSAEEFQAMLARGL